MESQSHSLSPSLGRSLSGSQSAHQHFSVPGSLEQVKLDCYLLTDISPCYPLFPVCLHCSLVRQAHFPLDQLDDPHGADLEHGVGVVPAGDNDGDGPSDGCPDGGVIGAL